MTGMHRCLPIALAGSLAAGVAMSFGQTYSPDSVAPLFNSAAPVVALAALVSLASRGGWVAHALLGAAAGPLAMAGYYATTDLRGFPVNLTTVVFWAVAGVVSGLAMGAAVWLLRGRTPSSMKGVAAGVLPGVALGEAAHGVARIAESTPEAYWWVQVAAGTVVLAFLGLTRLSTWRERLVAAAITVLAARALFVVYGLG